MSFLSCSLRASALRKFQVLIMSMMVMADLTVDVMDIRETFGAKVNGVGGSSIVRFSGVIG